MTAGAHCRAGRFHGSGDPSTGDDTHETFFQVLPTPRVYARFPFFDAVNSDDLFGSVLLRPGGRTTVRADVPRLRLSERADPWYVGGGAFEKAPSFGCTGRPSGGASDLAALADVSVEVRATPRIAVTLYGARASAGEVVRGIPPGSGPAWLGDLGLERRR